MAFDTALQTLIATHRPHLLALGEPYHGEPAFPRLRNRILETLAAHGFRAIAIESDRAAALAVDDYVQGRRDDIDLTTGISHGWGTHPATRELIDWLRAHNAEHPPGDRITFHGFDAPTEITGAPSPGPILRELRDYLSTPATDLDHLVGDDNTWTNQEIMYDAGRSPGRTPQAAALRALAENFRTQLYADAPRLIQDTSTPAWNRARVLATTAIGLLSYHAAMAEPGTQSQRIGRLLAARDALMAQNLLDILALERDRGPILVSANNAHLQRHPSRWASHWDGQDLAAQWNGAGSIVAPLLGDKYLYVAGSLGASGPIGLDRPEPGTYEHHLGPDTGIYPPPTASDLRERTTDLLGHFPLDTATIETSDAILHIGTAPGAAQAARITGLPGVTETRIPPGSDMPPFTWGDRFFFAGDDRKRPFATIVGHDVPDFDERSRLAEPGRYRLNIEVGRAEFQNLFGYGPEDFATHSDKLDFTETDRLLPHPAYAVQGWACVVNPGPTTADEVDRLLTQARTRSADRQHRKTRHP
ncbi:erythromycin esterase family protein [Actinoplanes sp. KI2]|uniref:erythromycin esterase family protein n=1 Tax=Actinoplanes sp. KI2 TaxID=2983315 RepID=UPI0021D5D09E|nr:erythromycin esterase family protein [Actinoplanes sp. KI2]MCU7722480.1 erythromycin esterase family protein [Actinoplanes sp. KI2]